MPILSFRKAIFTYFLGFCGIFTIPIPGKAQNDSLKRVPVEKLPLPIKSPANIRHVLVLPIIARSIETGWSFGLASASTFHLYKRDTTIRTSNAQAIALYTTRQQFVAALNGSIYFPGERWIINEQFSYSSFPDDFWGLGKRAPDNDEESYSFKQYYIYLHPQFKIGKHLFLGTVFEFQRVFDVEYTTGGLFDQENVLGRYGYQIAGLGLSLTYDTRNNAFWPDKGSMFQFWFDHFSPALGSDYQYTNYVIDLRRFIRLYKQQVLALQVYGSFNQGEVPLRSLAFLGGANSMRGYYAGRYRDKNAGILQAEYRIPLWWRIGAVGFADMGNVGPDVKDVNLQHFKYSYGGGLRIALNQAEKLNLRLDYGLAKGHSQGFYLQLGEAF
ncbi:MAG TPA: BamA/TamA family outer membrane protein [Puia sp.]|nr:BamA/TamA family outer membrane protein [Puia sp.]